MERGEKKQEFRHSFSFHFVPSFIIRHNAEISFNSPKLEVCFSVVYRNFFRLSELSLQQSSYCLSPPSSRAPSRHRFPASPSQLEPRLPR